MLGQRLSQKQLQSLSPQQIQLMKLLQVPTAMLEQRVSEELEANPALEEGPQERLEAEEPSSEAAEEEREFELDEYLEQYLEEDPVLYQRSSASGGPNEEQAQLPLATSNTFHDFLEQQIALLDIEQPTDEQIVRELVGNLDENGYLSQSILSIQDDLLIKYGLEVPESRILAILERVQRLDPPGVGARNLQECLLIQLQQKLDQAEENGDTASGNALRLASEIVEEQFEAYSKKHYDKIRQQLQISEDRLKAADDEIQKLNPKPASGFSGNTRNTPYIQPDFFVYNRDGKLELSLNSRNAPVLSVSDSYRDLLKSYKGKRRLSDRQKADLHFVKQKVDSARWFIEAIQQRQRTLYRTMQAILDYQYDYFLTGNTQQLRPMILKDIAEPTGLDLSTVSRVVNNKYVQTEFGILRLKDLFSESVRNAEGKEVSNLEVKQKLKELIESEDKHKPYSDQKLKDLLEEAGYPIARRTVAKYREQLGLPVARLRKSL
jgi:RNA polymerase sigma-54 factor